MLDYALHGDFSSFLSNKGKLCVKIISVGLRSFGVKLYYVRQLASIITYLRTNNYVHRDLKPSNLLLNERWQLVLADFGTAIQINKPEELLPVKIPVKKVS